MTDDELLEKSRFYLSETNWVLGQCCYEWMQNPRPKIRKETKEFADLVGMDPKGIKQRYDVYLRWEGTRDTFPKLKWSHFFVALTWTDDVALRCLEWANEMEATVAEMKAWQRANFGPPGELL